MEYFLHFILEYTILIFPVFFCHTTFRKDVYLYFSFAVLKKYQRIGSLSMSTLLNQSWEIVAALTTNDAWTINEALNLQGVWLLGAILLLAGGGFILIVYKSFPWLEKNFEKYVMVSSYLLIGTIIFVEVIRRFVFGVQAPWSTTLPPFLFLIMAWAGCAYNVKLRSHLGFSELRQNLPRPMQFFCLVLDAVLWIVFSWVVFVSAMRVTANSASNFQILLGTDDVLQWWFVISVPLSFMLITARSIENLVLDIKNYRSGAPLIQPISLNGEEDPTT